MLVPSVTITTAKHACVLCNQIFSQRSGYTAHLKTKKHRLNDPNNSDNTEFKCELCNVILCNKSTYSSHLKSNGHKSKDSNNTEAITVIKCETCNITLGSKTAFTQHLKTNSHKLRDPNNTKALTEFKCEKCNVTCGRIDSYRNHLKSVKHNTTPEEYKEILSQRMKNGLIHGAENESFIVELLETLSFDDVTYAGNTANMFDVFVKLKDEDHYRGLQIKTLVHYPIDNCFAVVLGKGPNKYEDDTLIIAVSNAKTKYALMFYGENKTTSVHFSATHNADKLYDDLDLFKIKLIEAARKSTIVNNFYDYLPETQKLEAESIDRFKAICDPAGISFRRNNINFDEIDAFVNNYNAQFKTSKSQINNIYKFNLGRCVSGCGHRPYNEDDRIDFFIFEIADEKYQGNFFIIPKKIFIELKYISTNNNDGKYNIHIPVPDYGKYHWTLQFFNRFDQLITGVNILLLFNNLHKICLDQDLQCEFSKNKIVSINTHKVRHIISSDHNNTSYRFHLETKENKPMNITHDDYSFIIFEILHVNGFYIVPMNILIKRGYIATNTNDGKKGISIPFQGQDMNKWSGFYNNFNQFINISNNTLML
jgi:hypothetical protein